MKKTFVTPMYGSASVQGWDLHFVLPAGPVPMARRRGEARMVVRTRCKVRTASHFAFGAFGQPLRVASAQFCRRRSPSTCYNSSPFLFRAAGPRHFAVGLQPSTQTAGGFKSGHPESNQGPSDCCYLYSQMLYQLSYSRDDWRASSRGTAHGRV